MSFSKFLAPLTLTALALAWAGNPARAADVTAPAAPAVVGAAPVVVSEGAGCASCQHGIDGGKCPKCGKLFYGRHFSTYCWKKPYPVHLSPGACFGYFQTQWRKWDEVCPHPYPGANGGQPGTELNPPRPYEPKMPEPNKVGVEAPKGSDSKPINTTLPKPSDSKKVGSDLPAIPVAPSKFTR